MIHETYFITFTKTAITKRWLRRGSMWKEVNGFIDPASRNNVGKVYIFADENWPFYVGKTKQPVGRRIGGAFRVTPEKRANGFAGYRFKNDRTDAFLHVFMGMPDWNEEDAECIEAEVVYRIRKASGWPRYQTEIHFSDCTPTHTIAADAIMHRFHQLKRSGGVPKPTVI